MKKRKALKVFAIIWSVISLMFLIEYVANIVYSFTYNIEELNNAMTFNIIQICFGFIFYIGNITISILTAIFCHKSKKYDKEALLLDKEAKDRKKQQKLAKLHSKIDKLEN